MGNKPKGPALTFLTGVDVKGTKASDAVTRDTNPVEEKKATAKKATK